jgi:hypothetical protein
LAINIFLPSSRAISSFMQLLRRRYYF